MYMRLSISMLSAGDKKASNASCSDRIFLGDLRDQVTIGFKKRRS